MPGSDSRMAASGGSFDDFDDGSSSVDAFGVVRRSNLGELMHQPVEFATRVTELAV